MKIIDRIVLERTVNLILNFILKLVQLFVPSSGENKPNKKRLFPNLRKKNE